MALRAVHRASWPHRGMLDGIAVISPCKMLVGPNTAQSFTPLGERYEGPHVKHRTNPFSEPQPQMPVLSASKVLIKSCCPSSYRLPMQMFASQYFSPFVTHNTSERTRHPVHRRLDWLAVLFFCRSHRCKPDSLCSSSHERCFNVQSGRR
jgi:hypothetical protein